MLAKNVNENACFLNQRGAFEFFASKLAPTGGIEWLHRQCTTQLSSQSPSISQMIPTIIEARIKARTAE